MKWVLGVDKCTTDYMIGWEPSRNKMAVEAGKTAVLFEEKTRRGKEGTILREILKTKKRKVEEEKRGAKKEAKRGSGKEKKNFLNGKGWSRTEYYRRLEGEEEVWGEIEERWRAEQEVEIKGKMRITKYGKEVKETLLEEEEEPEYLRRGGEIKGIKEIARWRLGNEARSSQYWKNEEERKCRMCEKEEESMEHIMERCEETKVGEGDWKRTLKEAKRGVAESKRIKRLRKQKDKEREKQREQQENIEGAERASRQGAAEEHGSGEEASVKHLG